MVTSEPLVAPEARVALMVAVPSACLVTSASVLVGVLLQSGQPVKWDGLGTFTPKVETIRRGLEKTDLQSGKANVNHDVAGIHIRFIPENSKGEEITSRKFADQCVFNVVGITKITKVTVNGKEKRYNELQLLEKWRKDNTPAPGE